MLVTARGVSKPGGSTLCGRSWWARPLDATSDEADAAEHGYFVVKYSCLPGHTTAHEVGHQLGAVHDWYTYLAHGSNLNVLDRAHGFSWYNGNGTRGFYTIMGTDLSCQDHVSGYKQFGLNCDQIGRWSDPEETHPQYGVPIGTSEIFPNIHASHEARVVKDNRVAVASYRLSLCRIANC